MNTRELRFLGMVLSAFLLASCNPGSPTALPTPGLPSPTWTPASTPTITPTPLPTIGVDPSALRGVNLQVWHAFSGSAYAVFISQVAQFNQANEWGIVVTGTGYGDYPTLFEAVNSALDPGGSPPGLVATLPEQTLAWNASGSVVDLSPYLADPAWGLGGDLFAGIPQVFRSQDERKGRLLGLPAQRSARFLFYNQTWAHELGFQDPPATADEFRQQACAANAAFRANSDPTDDGYGGWIVDTDWQTVYSWLLAFGGSVSDGNAYGFSIDPNLAALQFLKGLYDDHCAWISIEPAPFDSFARRSALFVSGDLAEVRLASDSMSLQKNSDQWTLLPFPGTEGSVVVSYGPSYSLLRSTPEKQLAAWLFARWLLSPENQAGWVQSTGLFPLLSSALDQTSSSNQSAPQWESGVTALPLAQGVPQLASWRKVRYVLEDGTNIIFQNNLPVDQIPSMLTLMDSTAKEISGK
jgi:multiple sugar transport system substrate-binding protein